MSEERVSKISEPEQITTLNKWEEVVNENFPEYLFPAKACLSVVSQLLINDIRNPFALVLVDAPSSGKTITLNFFSGLDEVIYTSDRFTPQAFVSHAANITKEKLAKVDLLPRIRYKTLIVREMGMISSQRDEDLQTSLGTLTRVLDGEGLQIDSGVHGQRGYQGDYLFMLLAGSTPLAPRVWRVMGNLGSRLFFLNMNSPDDDVESLVSQMNSNSWRDKQDRCRNITHEFLKTLWNKHPNGVSWDKDKDENEAKFAIARCAKLLAKIRGVINVWSEQTEDGTVTSHTEPNIERPKRITQLLYNLARGHAIINGRNYITKDDIKLIVSVAMNSGPKFRNKLFTELIKSNGSIGTVDVEIALDCSRPTALQEMEKFKLLGIGHITDDSEITDRVGRPEKQLAIHPEFEWFISNECKEMLGLSVIDDVDILNFD